MKTLRLMTLLTFGVAGSAIAHPILQFDVNGFSTQATNAAGTGNTAFGGLTHTGRVRFSRGVGVLAGLFVQNSPTSGSQSMGFNTSLFSMQSFDGEIITSNGQVTGGSITIRLNNNDSFTTQIVAGSGQVARFIGGGFTIQALTNRSFFNDNVFGNVNVAPWFNNQGANGLPGYFLQFSFNPNASGFSTADMDWFVDAVPLPPAAWTGLAVLGGWVVARRLRRS